MGSVGGFLEKEIDGKPFHIFTSLPQIDSPSSSSEAAIDFGDDNDLPLLQPRFLCPSLRLDVEELKLKENGYSSDQEKVLIPFTTPPNFPDRKTVDQHLHYLLDSSDKGDSIICKHPVLPLFWCNEERKRLICRACVHRENGTSYYLCVTCDNIFHKECVETPLKITVHPSYPLLSLHLHDFSIGVDSNCIICETSVGAIGYRCSIYKLDMHPVCAMKSIPIIIEHLKRHPHPLTFFPKQSSLVCDVCGMVKQFIPTYVCARCVFVVHQDCIYFPYVIRISRHLHRISFTLSLPSGNLSCGVCRRKIDNNCGAYSCNQCDSYFVHSRCALRKDLWDGEELEGVPEEPEIVEEPFQTIADGIILHFSHGHHLQLEIIKVYDENKVCQGCVLPIYEGNYYSCVVGLCDFILHEACANAPLKIRHQLNGHPLTLKVVTTEYNRNEGRFPCRACRRWSCGFVYEGYTRSGGRRPNFRLDLRCASIYEPFQYEGHEHPLFLALSPEEEKSAMCQICDFSSGDCRKLSCIECDYIICFKCATLPYKARYKHDKHFLTFRKVDTARDQSDWCEACEKKIVSSGKHGFYVCDDYCCILFMLIVCLEKIFI